jgi:hypothetical protein
MSSAGTPQRHVVTVRWDHHCVTRNPRELLVHRGMEVFAQHLHEEIENDYEIKNENLIVNKNEFWKKM